MFSSVCGEKEYLMVDQIVPPTNLNRYLRYFDDIKVCIVDRDPRDILILEKHVWKDGVISNDVETFCKWFQYTRAHRKAEKNDEQKVLLFSLKIWYIIIIKLQIKWQIGLV